MDRGQGEAARSLIPTLIARHDALEHLAAAVRPPYVDPLVVLIEGPAGIGKTSLLRAGLAQAEAFGVTCLRASPLEAEVSFAYATLGDLFEPHLARLTNSLSSTHLATFERALGLEDPTTMSEQASNAQQTSVAVLAALRAMTARGPVVVAIDDAGWIDQASREALTYAVRRLDDVPIRLILTRRSDAPGAPPPFGLADAARPVAIDRVWLKPLSLGALQSVLQGVTGSTFSRPNLLRIHEISGGNPFYAIELARAIAALGATLRPGQDLPVPSSLRDLVADRLSGLDAASQSLLLTAAMSSKPTVEMLAARAGRDPLPLLKSAVSAGLVRVEGHLVSFAHPLFASTLVAEASDEEREATHAWLGRAAGEDLEARARHLALSTTGTNAVVAAQLARGAELARQRGAPAVAGELADLSVERTLATDKEWSERALLAADAWFVAGDFAAVRVRVANLLPRAKGQVRARALTLDGLATWYTGTSGEAVASLLQGLADAGSDPALAGIIHYYLSILVNDDIRAARKHAINAAQLLSRTPDRGHHAAALLQAFYLSVLVGDQPPMALLEQGLAAEKEGPLVDRLTSPGIWWAATGRLDLARERFRHMLEFDRIHGVFSNVSNLLTRLAEVELWSDDWPAARRLASAAIEADLETDAPPGEMAMRALALVDALEGRLEDAGIAAEAGVERSERTGAYTLAAAWLQVTALVGASRDDSAAVVDAGARASRHLVHIGYREPLRLDPAPEHIEALVALDRQGEAEQELEALKVRQLKVPKPWAAAAIARATARLVLARNDLAGALAATDVFVPGDPPGWSRFDVARVLLVRGEAFRRARSRRAAADVLVTAQRIFTDLGAAVWAQRAADEVARLGLHRSAALALTPMEARVARLAGEGLSTRAVAADLGISPRTVETHLAAVYGKLGVSSRAALGRAMARLEDS